MKAKLVSAYEDDSYTGTYNWKGCRYLNSLLSHLRWNVAHTLIKSRSKLIKSYSYEFYNVNALIFTIFIETKILLT